MILKIRVCHHAGWMQIRMENLETLTPERITEFLSSSAGIDFTGQSRTERHAWLQSILAEQQYFSLNKKQRGAVRALLGKVAGLSLPQITRLRSLPEAHRYLKDGMRWELLDGFAYARSDTEATRRMMRAKIELLRQCKLESPFPPRFVCGRPARSLQC
jgi:hypothetical protein